ncbi:DUF2807 domain-containing protein [Dehalogenimonas formicexedens]|uniref:DUF2807 domain-containing protein n=1 Tax=Dehalogenimonas formicexedens TaxID=1839801 RepID=A0A1P8F4K1_9CHLR|nr:DUF2807 domain-containing protein [Dehalogenimonas formicexedens]APV43409.1 DUF2807 domain-containing protein [Dehalogenimonas formicexedens]
MITKIFGIILVASMAVAGIACIPFGSIVGRGPVETRNQDFSGFTKIEISSTFKVEVVRDSGYSVSVTTNENIFGYLDFSQEGDTLKIKLKDGSYTVASLKARITAPEIASLQVSGASSASLSGFTSNANLKLVASGASSIELDSIKCGDLDANVSGASKIKGSMETGNATFLVSGASNVSLSGQGRDLKVTCSGASRGSLKEFASTNAKVSFSGASNGDVSTSGRLDVTLSGASSLKYYGNATLGDVNVTGASSLNKG